MAGALEKTIALPHADLLRVAAEVGRKVDDPWCSRLGAMHLRYLVETGEDMEKDLVTVSAAELKRYAEKLARHRKSSRARWVVQESVQYYIHQYLRDFLARSKIPLVSTQEVL